MQQRQLRLGDILDDYCPRERRVTNHAIVAMVGEDVKQTRCTTCDAEHEFKHAKVPRQRRKNEAPAALYAQVAASAPKRVTHDAPASIDTDHDADRDAPASAEPQSLEPPSEEIRHLRGPVRRQPYRWTETGRARARARGGAGSRDDGGA